jgi:hypothetical protein
MNVNKRDHIMNFKIKIILLVGVFLMSMGSIVYSQGVFQNNSTAFEKGATTTTSAGIFTTGQETLTATDKPGPGGGDSPGDEGETTPIGEGLAILGLLSGGYIMLKKRKSKERQ